MRSTLAAILILCGTAAAEPPCRQHTGPPSCAPPTWRCASPVWWERAASERVDRAYWLTVTRAQLTACTGRADVREAQARDLARVARLEAQAREAELLRVVEALERERGPRGHPTWVLVTSVVGGVVVGGVVAGLAVYMARR